MVRSAIVSFLLLTSQLSWGKPLQVPENCIALKNAPCLVQFQAGMSELPVEVSQIQIQGSPDTIVKWNSFEKNISLEVVKGKIQVDFKESKAKESLSETIQVNDIVLANKSMMIQKEDSSLEVFDDKTFVISTYTLPVKEKAVPLSERFLDKSELVHFIAPFFRTKNKLGGFLKSISNEWKTQFDYQATHQTNVLRRSLASEQEEKERLEAERLRNEAELKKVREQFFYRTFYR